MILDLATEGNYVACRPSGTEPKIKFYMFAYTPPEQLANLDAAKQSSKSGSIAWKPTCANSPAFEFWKQVISNRRYVIVRSSHHFGRVARGQK